MLMACLVARAQPLSRAHRPGDALGMHQFHTLALVDVAPCVTPHLAPEGACHLCRVEMCQSLADAREAFQLSECWKLKPLLTGQEVCQLALIEVLVLPLVWCWDV